MSKWSYIPMADPGFGADGGGASTSAPAPNTYNDRGTGNCFRFASTTPALPVAGRQELFLSTKVRLADGTEPNVCRIGGAAAR